MATTHMAAVLVRFFQAITLSTILIVGMTAVFPTAAHADMSYGSGVYGGDIYNGSNSSVVSGGGGACINCRSTSTSTISASTTASTTSTSTASNNPVNNTSTAGGTTTPHICASVAAGGDLSLAQLVNLFVSLGIIPQDKAKKACDALSTHTEGQPTPATFRFTTPLKLGTRSADVKALQLFLNTHGYVIASSGDGSVGHETNYFGVLTFNAVKRFQQAYKAEILTPVGLTIPSGIFGPSSMKKANALIGR